MKFTLTEIPREGHTLNQRYWVITSQDQSIRHSFFSRFDAEAALIHYEKAYSIPIPIEVNKYQERMIRSKLVSLIKEQQDITGIRFGTAIARGFMGRKPAVNYGDKVIVYEAEGYPLDMVNGTWNDA